MWAWGLLATLLVRVLLTVSLGALTLSRSMHSHSSLAQACALVEIFNSLPGKGSTSLVGLLRVLAGFGLDGVQAFRCVIHDEHPAWSQTDGSSCGIFCALIIVSLVRGLRVHVRQDDVKVWRAFLHREVVIKGNFTNGAPNVIAKVECAGDP